MKKIVRITESEITNIVKRVIKENTDFIPIDGSGKMNKVVGNIVRKIYQKRNGEKVIKYFFEGKTPRVPRTDRNVIDFLPGDEPVGILLCGVPDNLAHLINDPNGLVSIQWAGMGTPGGSEPNDPCTSPIELQMKEHKQPEKEEVDDWWNNEIKD